MDKRNFKALPLERLQCVNGEPYEKISLLMALFLSSGCMAGQNSMNFDPTTGSMIKNQDGVLSEVELPKLNAVHTNGKNGYTKNRFTYVNKLGDRMNCLNLVEGDFLKADLTNKGWDATVQNKDGTKGNFIFQGNASFIKTTTNGYAFCVNNS